MSFRYKRRGLRAVLMACAVIVGALAGTAHVASALVSCPTGGTRSANVGSWTTLWPTAGQNAKGIALCQGRGREIEARIRGYLETVDLGDGAKIRLHTEVDPGREGEIFEPNTLFRKRYAEEWYSWLRSKRFGERWAEEAGNYTYVRPEPSRLFSVTNATFFKDAVNANETRMPLPMETWGHQSTIGVAWLLAHPNSEAEQTRSDSDYEAPKRMLQIGSPEGIYEEEIRQIAEVTSFPARYEFSETIEAMEYSLQEAEYGTIDGAVGFTPEYGVGASARRNYVGVYGDTVYIFVSNDSFTNAQVRETMQEIQPGMSVVQMDGGGSTQFYSAYGEMLSVAGILGETRKVPSVLAVYRAR